MNPKSPEAKDEKPFVGMHIDDTSLLDELTDRYPCTICHKSRKYFCYTCYIPVQPLLGRIPQVKLPLKIDIIKHPNEIDGKSTAIHAAVLAPGDVNIYTYPNIPDYRIYGEEVVLIFPSTEAICIKDLFSTDPRRNKYKDQVLAELPIGYNIGTLLTKTVIISDQNLNSNGNLPVRRAVFIDSTWNQSRGIYRNEKINCLKTIVIQNRPSQFWRHQKNSPRWYLSTIEAIHQFLIEIHLHTWGLDSKYKGPYCEDIITASICEEYNKYDLYNGQYDNLLFFFKYLYEKIHELYDHEQLQAYKRPMNLNK